MTGNGFPLSVIVITLNEEKNIRECLESVAWADDIVVVDARSRDRTTELARQYTEKVFVADWNGYAGAKEFALTKTNHEWVLWLDADERVTPALAAEIRDLLKKPNPAASAYEIPRRAFFLGKWIRHCGWYPGYVTRLFRRQSARFSSSLVHEHLEVSGDVSRLHSAIDHYTDDTLFHYFRKFNNYTSLAARDLRLRHKVFRAADLIFRPPFLFLKMYVIKRGFLDGWHGLVLAMVSAAYVFTKYAKRWELDADV